MTERIGLLIAVLLVSSATDIATGLVYDCVTIPALGCLLVIAGLHGDFESAASGAATAGGALLIVHLISRGRGMGLGDVKLGAVIGAALGSYAAILSLGCAFVLGACVGVGLIATNRAQRTSELRFAPFLAIGVGLTLVVGDALR